MIMFINSVIISMSIMLIFMNHPLSMGAIMLFQTILVCLIVGLINSSYWFSYILFIIMVGGLLILFIYMTSVASNEKFKFSNLLSMFMSIMISISFATIIFDQYLFNHTQDTPDLIYQSEFLLSMNKYLNMPSLTIFYLTIIYLLISLIASVKISTTHKGPLRQNN
uniref:NADH-ubiquinone oxidoreductase chain 6 n=1 Tax=Melyridae sp. GENSP01 TaxID=1205563 RepID=A0A0S2MPJ5_9CUCU|nr:NADH deshydrogenase subunit 6 [Melyridae sp. GENSP01]